jgi:arylsulfatase A-like enzyme
MRLVTAGACAAAIFSAACGDGAERPSVIVIIADDAGYVDFGSYGSTEFPTPNIDAIAARGVRFTAGYTTASVCSPSRAGLITGRYQQRFGHEFNLPRTPQAGSLLENMGLRLDQRTLADAMQALGYRTAAIGKWHLGYTTPYHPLERGFDEFFGFLHGSRSYFPITRDMDGGTRILRNDAPQPEQGYLTDVLADEATAFIERNRDQQFFLYLSFNAVHTPMHAKPEHESRFASIDDERRRTLGGMTLALDEAVGQITAKLDDLGLLENTLVFFINDNGGATNNASTNGPLRGQKGDKFEGGIRVPFMVQWPATLPQGVDYALPVSALDIFPTVTSTVSGRTADSSLDGVNLLPYLTGEIADRPHEMLYWRRGVVAAVRRGDWKLIRVAGEPAWLFDLADDPWEERNRLSDHPALVEELLEALDGWEADMVEPLWRTDPYWTQNQIEKHRANQ